jgi:Zn-dependent protease with chaperone function
MLSAIGNYIRLIYRLFIDKRINIFYKIFLILLPLLYFILPVTIITGTSKLSFTKDFIPVTGLIDDFLILFITSYVFLHICPLSIIDELKDKIKGTLKKEYHKFEKYRYRDETRDLSIGFALILLLNLLTGIFGGLFILLIFIISFLDAKSTEQKIKKNMVEITKKQLPEIWISAEKAKSYLTDIDIKLYISNSNEVNAYTFGFIKPYTIVLHSALINLMTPDEIQAVIGHEMGHILFGHTKLNTIIRSSKSFLGDVIFYKWSRSAEFSADGIAWVASGKDTKTVVSTFLRLLTGTKKNINVEEFLKQSDTVFEKISPDSILRTHPDIRKRILNILELEKKKL